MISLVFIVLFLLCLAIAVASVLISYQSIQNYNTAFHKNYFYYLIAFYAFALYGIWGQLIVRTLLSEIDTSVRIVETIANFLPILGVPFIFVSWIMLVNMAYSIVDRGIDRRWQIFHIALFVLLIAGAWFGYDYFNEKARFSHELLKYFGVGLISILELIYYTIFLIIVIVARRRRSLPEHKLLLKFAWLLILVFLIRSLIIPFSFSNLWFLPPVILGYFLSNFVPLFYLWRKADLIFQLVKADNASDEKIELIFNKYKITKREKEIVTQICTGKTNQQIADELFISLQTVKDHTHRIYSKLGINSRMKLVQLINR